MSRLTPGPFAVLALLKSMSRPGVRVYTIYIGDRLREMGYRFTPAILLRRLRLLERSGFVSTDNRRRGYYGMEWRLTEAGEKFLPKNRSNRYDL